MAAANDWNNYNPNYPMADKQLEIVFPDDVTDDGTPLYHYDCRMCKGDRRP